MGSAATVQDTDTYIAFNILSLIRFAKTSESLTMTLWIQAVDKVLPGFQEIAGVDASAQARR